MTQICPVCDDAMIDGCCFSCGYDDSEDFLTFRTCAPVPHAAARRFLRIIGTEGLSAFVPMPKRIKPAEKAVIVDSGKAGKTLIWTRDQAGTLTISGNGAMNDYLFCGPWGSGPYLTRAIVKTGVTSIGELAFSGCTSLEEVEFPEGLKTIGQEAFSGCRSLTWLTLRKGLTSIGTSAFSRCSALIDASFPEGLTRIGKNAFIGCESLRKVTLEKGVREIDESAFALCTALMVVSLPEGLTSIGEGVFNRCRSLVSVTLPEGITKLHGFAFSGCDDLRDVYYAGSESGRKAEEANWSRTGNDAFFNARWHYAK